MAELARCSNAQCPSNTEAGVRAEFVFKGDSSTCMECGLTIPRLISSELCVVSSPRQLSSPRPVSAETTSEDYKAMALLKEMAGHLTLPQSDTFASQAHGVMKAYEKACRVRQAAWALRLRMACAVLAMAAEALDGLVGQDQGETDVAGHGYSDGGDQDIAALATRVRQRLVQARRSKDQERDWAGGLMPGAVIKAQSLPPLPAAVAMDTDEHPSRVPGAFAVMRMTYRQIRDDVLQTTDENARACRAVQERLWQEPAVRLVRDQLGVRDWPDFDEDCRTWKVEFEERHKVFDMLKSLAVEQSVCRTDGARLGFTWTMDERTEVVAGAALWVICRKNQHAVGAILLEEVVEKALQRGLRHLTPAGVSNWGKDHVKKCAEDMAALGVVTSVEPLRIELQVRRSVEALVDSLGRDKKCFRRKSEETTGAVSVQDACSVATALFAEAQRVGVTQGRQPKQMSAAIAMLALHMQVTGQRDLVPMNLNRCIGKVSDHDERCHFCMACKALGVEVRTIKDLVTEMKKVVVDASKRAQVTALFTVNNKNVWVHGRDVLMDLHPPAAQSRALAGQDQTPAPPEPLKIAERADSVHRLRSKQAKREASAERALQWYRAVKQGVQQQQLSRDDQIYLTIIQEMIGKGTLLDCIDAAALLERHGAGEGRRCEVGGGAGARTGGDRGRATASLGGSGGHGGEWEMEDVMSAEELREGGEYVYSAEEVARRRSYTDMLPDLAPASDRARKCPKIRTAGRNEPARSAKVDYAKVKEVLGRSPR